jgi:hypothetical protein
LPADRSTVHTAHSAAKLSTVRTTNCGTFHATHCPTDQPTNWTAK